MLIHKCAPNILCDQNWTSLRIHVSNLPNKSVRMCPSASASINPFSAMDIFVSWFQVHRRFCLLSLHWYSQSLFTFLLCYIPWPCFPPQDGLWLFFYCQNGYSLRTSSSQYGYSFRQGHRVKQERVKHQWTVFCFCLIPHSRAEAWECLSHLSPFQTNDNFTSYSLLIFLINC